MTTPITVSVDIAAPIEHVRACWTDPKHIVGRNFASDDRHCPAATNELEVGKGFSATMAAKDGSTSFDFEGTYTAIVPHEHIAYVMADGRKVDIRFEEVGELVRVTEVFDPENVYPAEVQQAGWQSILDTFRNYTQKINQS